MNRLAGALVLLVSAAGCASSEVGEQAPTPTVAATPTPTEKPTPLAPPSPVETPEATEGAVSDLFPSITGFEYGTAPSAQLELFEQAVDASVAGSGSLGDAVAAEAIHGDEPPVFLALFTLDPASGRSEEDLLALVMRDMARGAASEWQPNRELEAFVMDVDGDTSVITKVAAEPFSLFLFAHGPAGAPVEEVVEGVLADYTS